jgi:hypothetical protein
MAEIRPFPFSDPAIQKAIDRTLASIPEDEHFHAIFVGDGEGVRTVAAVRGKKFGMRWSFSGFIDKPYKGKLIYGVEAGFSC